MKMECDYLNGWMKKTVTYAKISPKSCEPQGYSWGTKKKKKKIVWTNLSSVLSDTLPERFEDTVKGLNTVGCCCFCQSRQSQGCDSTHLLLFIHQTCTQSFADKSKQSNTPNTWIHSYETMKVMTTILQDINSWQTLLTYKRKDKELNKYW